MDTIQVGAEELLGIIAHQSRQVVTVCENPANLDTQRLLDHLARQYTFAEKLHELATLMRKTAEEAAANGEAKAN